MGLHRVFAPDGVCGDDGFPGLARVAMGSAGSPEGTGSSGAPGVAGCAHVPRQIDPRSPGVSSPALVALPATRDEDWPMFRDDLERSGFAQGSAVAALVEIL